MFCPLLYLTLANVPLRVWTDLETGGERVPRWSSWKEGTIDSACRRIWSVLVLPRNSNYLILYKWWINWFDLLYCFVLLLQHNKTLTPWKKNYDQPRQHMKKQRPYFASKDPYSQSYGFSSSHVWMWALNYKESWVPKNWCFWTVVLEKTLWESLGLQGDPTSPS